MLPFRNISASIKLQNYHSIWSKAAKIIESDRLMAIGMNSDGSSVATIQNKTVYRLSIQYKMTSKKCNRILQLAYFPEKINNYSSAENIL
jgi:hypothetical protein